MKAGPCSAILVSPMPRALLSCAVSNSPARRSTKPVGRRRGPILRRTGHGARSRHRCKLCERTVGSSGRAGASNARAVCRRIGLPGLEIFLVGIEKTMQMDDEITPVGVVDAALCRRAPSLEGGGVVGKDADDVERRRIGEHGLARVGQLAAEHEMEEMFDHGLSYQDRATRRYRCGADRRRRCGQRPGRGSLSNRRPGRSPRPQHCWWASCRNCAATLTGLGGDMVNARRLLDRAGPP